jgi:hypothetical protein
MFIDRIARDREVSPVMIVVPMTFSRVTTASFWSTLLSVWLMASTSRAQATRSMVCGLGPSPALRRAIALATARRDFDS